MCHFLVSRPSVTGVLISSKQSHTIRMLLCHSVSAFRCRTCCYATAMQSPHNADHRYRFEINCDFITFVSRNLTHGHRHVLAPKGCCELKRDARVQRYVIVSIKCSSTPSRNQSVVTRSNGSLTNMLCVACSAMYHEHVGMISAGNCHQTVSGTRRLQSRGHDVWRRNVRK